MPIRQRDIYWLDDCEPLDGDEDKDRPVVVLSPPELITSKAPFLLVVACSTHPRSRDVPRFRVPPRTEEAKTGLPKACWAIPRWYLWMNRYRLKEIKGKCPEPLFVEIFNAVDAQMEIDKAAGKNIGPPGEG